MKLSAYVAVKDGAALLPTLLNQLAMLADELIVMVEAKSSDESEEIARSFTRKVQHFTFDPVFRELQQAIWQHCTGDWILSVDADETLSPEWTRDRLKSLMETRRLTHYYVPRRWLVDDGAAYLSNSPWYPDHQLRLIRNIPSIVQPIVSIHRPRKIDGEVQYLADLNIYHWNFILNGRAFRERRAAESRELDPGTPVDAFYLYEDYYNQQEPYNDRPFRKGSPPISGDLGHSEYCVDIFIRQTPARFVASETYAVEIEVVNRSTRTLEPELPYREPRNMSFSHHWYQDREGESVVYEYGASRCPLSTAIPVGNSHRALVNVRMPALPGDYLLRFDMVEEFKAWFFDADATGFRDERCVRVQPH
jgi:hypothetical protein